MIFQQTSQKQSMVSCQEPSPLKGSKHSLQCHPHDACTFVCVHGGGARCCPLKSTAHHHHIKRQPFLWLPLPWLLQMPSPLPSPPPSPTSSLLPSPSLSPLQSQSPIANAIVVSHCHCGCRQPLLLPSLLRCRQPSLLPLPLPSAIAVSVTVSHCSCHCRWPSPLPCRQLFLRELLPWHGKNCIQPIEAKNAYLTLFCSDSGRCTDQSRMTDQVSSGNGQHQHWAASSKYQADSEGSGWQQGGSRGAEGWRC
jgi:hypothetical protein